MTDISDNLKEAIINSDKNNENDNSDKNGENDNNDENGRNDTNDTNDGKSEQKKYAKTKTPKTETKEKKKISPATKIFIISLAVIFFPVALTAGIYLWKGPAGFSKILGFDKQEELDVGDLTDDEADYLYSVLGIREGENVGGLWKNKKYHSLKLSSAEFTILINCFLKKPDAIKNLKIEITESNTVKLSAYGGVSEIIDLFGGARQDVEEQIGKLPDNVAVYIELDLPPDGSVKRIKELKVGQMKIPKVLVKYIEPNTEEGIEAFFDNALDISLEDISVSHEKINISGEFPTK